MYLTDTWRERVTTVEEMTNAHIHLARKLEMEISFCDTVY